MENNLNPDFVKPEDGKPLYSTRHKKDPYSEWTTFITIRGYRLRWLEDVIDKIFLWLSPPKMTEDNLKEYGNES